jgi:hypothetical protein
VCFSGGFVVVIITMSTEEKPQIPEATTTTTAIATTGDDDIQPSDPVVEELAVGSETEALRGPNGEEYPTREELQTLRRVKGKINWLIYTVAFCELCERFAYYGTTIVCKYALPFQCNKEPP